MSWRASGLKAWMLQRVSAIYIALYLVYFLGVILVCQPSGYQEWHEWITSLPMSLATTVFFLALLAHAWVGMRDVFLDYIKPFVLRLILLTLLAVGLLVMALWVIRILLAGS